MAILMFLFAAALIWILWKAVHMKGWLGDLFRLSWNITMSVFSIFPGLGWTTRFMILDDSEAKEELIRMGDEQDRQTLENLAEKRDAERRTREREEQERREAEDDVRRQVYQETGRTDVQFNSDSSKWKLSDENWYDSRNVDR